MDSCLISVIADNLNNETRYAIVPLAVLQAEMPIEAFLKADGCIVNSGILNEKADSSNDATVCWIMGKLGLVGPDEAVFPDFVPKDKQDELHPNWSHYNVHPASDLRDFTIKYAITIGWLA